MKIRIKFEPRDMWVGVYRSTWSRALWTGSDQHDLGYTEVRVLHRWYVCLVPCVPIILTWETRRKI